MMLINSSTEGPEVAKHEKDTTTGNNVVEQPEPKRTQPPPIPPRWTRPNIAAVYMTPTPPSPDKGSPSVLPPTVPESAVAPVELDAAIHSKIESDAELSAYFANLALNTSVAVISRPAPPTAVPGVPSSPNVSPTKKRKFYSVTIGKRTGVFNNWPYVESLVNRVPGSKQISFKTEAEAYEHYSAAKSNGLVKVVRVTLADDEVFGPADQAIE